MRSFLMKRLLIYLFLVHTCVTEANIYQLTQDTLKMIGKLEREDAEGSFERIQNELAQYKVQLKAYLHRGLDVNVRGISGQTALMLAVQEANSVVTVLLLENSADVIEADDEDFTPLMHFVSHWIVQEDEVYCIRSNPVARTYQSPEQCMNLLLGAGSESLELALLHVEHIRARRSEDVQALQHEGLKKLVTQITLKLNPKSLLEKTKRRIQMRRLRRI
jgi:ankyrin repeat protein